MELHRLDGFDATGLDSTDIQDTSAYINGVTDPRRLPMRYWMKMVM